MRIAVLAGEPSGDNLGAGLIAALRKRFPDARFEGVGGERMKAVGLHSLFPIERLSVMGLIEVLAHLPSLVRIRRSLIRHFLINPPDVFIGIDAPDFNLGLELKLRANGIRTVHYVSPQVWAWRRRRVVKIARAVDLMLTLLPFERDFYLRHGVPVRYVGHPLADEIPLRPDRHGARRLLGFDLQGVVLVALLPGSRLTEVRRIGPLFLETACWLNARCPNLHFVSPAATPSIAEYLRDLSAELAPVVSITVLNGGARHALAAADLALVASGTATLETLLSKCPMVVAYRVSPFSAWVAARLIDVSWFALPNLLADRELVPEFIQQQATVTSLGPAILALLEDFERRVELERAFETIHRSLRRDANRQAAAAIAELLVSTG